MSPPLSYRVQSLVGVLLCLPVVAQVTQRVNVSSAGEQANDWSRTSSISADGRYVTFQSLATNLVPGDTNGYGDVFVRDRASGTTERVSVSSSGAQGNEFSDNGWLTPDGRYVSFLSHASNLVPGDGNGSPDAFVRDRWLGTTELVSRSTTGEIGNQGGYGGPITPDGRYVCLTSTSSNLVPGVPGGYFQVYVRDRLKASTEIASVSTGGSVGDNSSFYTSISDDGRLVAFVSFATNLVPGDTNHRADAFVHDRQSGTTERVSLTAGGSEANGGTEMLAMSGDGRYIAFGCDGSNLVQGAPPFRVNLYVRDRQQGTTELVSVDSNGTPGDGDCDHPRISGDGRFVVFESDATNLVPGDTNLKVDVFLRDRRAGVTTRESVDSMEVEGNEASVGPAVSADGRYVVFWSAATNLVPGGDNNSAPDGFVRDRLGGTSFRSLCNPGAAGVIACPCANAPSSSGQGCDNSSGTGGAILSASGGAYLSSDSLVFTTSGERPTALSIVTQWTSQNPTGAIFGQGVRCTSGTFKRLYTKSAVGGSITAPEFGAGDLQVSVRSAALGDMLLAGQSRWHFVYYRDPNVLGGCPATSTFNCTQTGQVTWSP